MQNCNSAKHSRAVHKLLKGLLSPLYVWLGIVHPLYRFIWSQSENDLYSTYTVVLSLCVACLRSLHASDHWHRLTNWITVLWLGIGGILLQEAWKQTEEAQVQILYWTKSKLLNVSSMYAFMQHIQFTSNININFNNYKHQSQDPIHFSFSMLTPPFYVLILLLWYNSFCSFALSFELMRNQMVKTISAEYIYISCILDKVIIHEEITI